MARILMVEDEEIILLYYKQLLGRMGYQFDAATSVEEAEALLAAQEYAVVITDLRLGDGDCDGLDLLSGIRQRDPELPVVVTTGNQDLEVQRKVIQFGSTKLLLKPFNKEELLAALRAAGVAPPAEEAP